MSPSTNTKESWQKTLNVVLMMISVVTASSALVTIPYRIEAIEKWQAAHVTDVERWKERHEDSPHGGLTREELRYEMTKVEGRLVQIEKILLERRAWGSGNTNQALVITPK